MIPFNILHKRGPGLPPAGGALSSSSYWQHKPVKYFQSVSLLCIFNSYSGRRKKKLEKKKTKHVIHETFKSVWMFRVN